MKRNVFVAVILIMISSLIPHYYANSEDETVPQGKHSHNKNKPFESLEKYISFLDEPGRGEWQKPDKVIEVLRIKSGDSVADIGAGSGYFTIPFAKTVGAEGTVLAIDIEQGMLDHIKKTADSEKLSNINLVKVNADSSGLKEKSVNIVFICDTYHHIENRKIYFQKLKSAIKDNGRLVIVEFQKKEIPFGPPLWMKIKKEDVINEIEDAGFKLEEEYYFLPYQYFLVFGAEK